MENKRRKFIIGAAMTAPVVAITACSELQNIVSEAGTAAGAAAIDRIVSYIQASISTLETIVATFGSGMSDTAKSEANSALAALSNAAGAFGSSVASGASATSSVSFITGAESLLSAAIGAVVIGLGSIANPGAAVLTAITIAKEVQTVIPVIVATINSVRGTPAPVGTKRAAASIAINNLGIIIP